MKYIALFIMLFASAFGAMTREQICIEQNRFHQGVNAQVRGFNVWTPYGSNSEQWVMWQFKRHTATTDGVTCYDLADIWIAKVRAGTYIPAYCTTGKPDELTFTGGNWTEAYPGGWSSINFNTNARTVTVAVPAGTTRLYMFGHKVTGAGTMTVSTDGSGSLVKTTLDNGATGDWSAYSAPSYLSAILIATNCGGDNITFTPSAAADFSYIDGFIAINDSVAAQPDTGVFDPVSLIRVSHSVQTSATAVCPFSLKFGAGGTGFWWGLGHWGAEDTLTNEAETLTYGSGGTSWAPAESTWVRQATDSFVMRLTGDMHAVDTEDRDFGDYTLTWKLNSSGMSISQKALFNATAAAQAMYIDTPGCYSERMALNATQFTKFKVLPYNTTPISIVGPFDDTDYGNYDAANAVVYGGPHGVVATTNSFGTFWKTGGTVPTGNPLAFVRERQEGYHTVYVDFMGSAGDTAIAENDYLETISFRTVTDEKGYNTIPAQQTGMRSRYNYE